LYTESAVERAVGGNAGLNKVIKLRRRRGGVCIWNG